MNCDTDLVTAVLLAGGRGTRMQSQDKGLMELDGKPLIQHMLNRIVPQVGEVIISCNRNVRQYEKFGYRVTTDSLPNYPGPLAGVLSANPYIDSPFCFIAPTDMPYLPLDIVSILFQKIASHQVATASVEGRLEPLISLARSESVSTIADYLISGRNSVRGWLESLPGIEVPVDAPTDAFRNLNRPEDFRSA